MNITFTGLGIEVTQALRDTTEKKIERISRHFDRITSIDVTFSVQKLRQIAEAKINVKDSVIHASAESDDLYAAIDSLVTKLDTQVRKHKEKTGEHR